MKKHALESSIDNTLLKPESTEDDIREFVQSSLQYSFAGLCIPPYYLPLVRNLLGGSKRTQLVTVIGFPLGYQLMSAKIQEGQLAIDNGADELDMVMNIAAFKSGRYDVVKEEMQQFSDLCRTEHKVSKVIIESALLNFNELERVCQLAAGANVDFVKTSTGFSSTKLDLDRAYIAKLRSLLPDHIKIKASGGIKDAGHAWELINAGADRIGTSSGIQMMEEENSQ